MKAKKLLKAAFTLRKGEKYLPIVREVVSGSIEPKSDYIQTFDKYTFCNISVDPDVEFITTACATCYLYKVD